MEGGVEVLPMGVTAATGLAAGTGLLYVVESTTTDGSGPVPETGRLIRVETVSGEAETVASGLSLPSGAVFGPDGLLYVSNRSFGFPAGSGEILRFDVGR